MQEKIQNIHQKFNAPQNEIRLAIMNFIVDNHRPFSLKEDGYTALKGITLSSAEDFSSITEVLCEKDGMVTDEEGNVNFIYPVSALPTNHHVTLADGREFCAMCAIDAIGSAFTFHQDTEIHSKCSSCGADVFVRVKDGKIVEHSPADLHALTFTLGEIANWAGSCWNAMNFFCKKNEMEQYIADMELDLSTVIQADMDIALKEAIATFNV